MSLPLTQVPEFYTTEFSQNWDHMVQQMQARLKEFAVTTSVKGKEKTFNLFGPQEMTRKMSRNGATKHSDVTLEKYWLRPLPYELANLFDEFDESFLGEVVLPTSEAMQSMAYAYLRKCDDVIISALGGNRYTGETGTTAVPLPSSQQVAVNYVAPATTGSNSGLNLQKLIKAKSILGKNEVDPSEQLIFAYSQAQLDNLLLNVDQVSNSRYSDVKALYDGKTEYFMGFKFVKLERLPLTSGVRTCFAYVKSGVKFADDERKSYMDILPTESHSLQIRTTAKLGASRTEEKKVVAVYCDETV